MERDVRSLLRAISSSAVEEIRLEQGGVRLRLKRRLAEPASGDAPPLDAVVQSVASAPAALDDASSATLEVRSAYVGIFHRSREPGGVNLAERGAHVDAGKPIGVIETLGMSGDVECPVGGTLVELHVVDGQPVEYGQALATIQPD